MTKKDYELIAGVMREEVERWQGGGKVSASPVEVLMMLSHSLAAKLKQQNPKFKSKTFEEACGLG